jgi:hypothetical protein
MPAPTKHPNLLPGGPGYREGKVQRVARRVLIAAGSTAVHHGHPDGVGLPQQAMDRVQVPARPQGC